MPFYYYLRVRDQNHVPLYEIWAAISSLPQPPPPSVGFVELEQTAEFSTVAIAHIHTHTHLHMLGDALRVCETATTVWQPARSYCGCKYRVRVCVWH